MFLEITLSLFYTLIFLFLIKKVRFFEIEGLSRKFISFIFILKIIVGVILWIIYTFYYTNNMGGDVNLYFMDGNVMFNALLDKPKDFFQMFFGINHETDYFTQNYYKRMNVWSRIYEVAYFNDSRTMIRVNALFRIFSFGFYNVHSIFMCFLSLMGLTALYKTFIPYLKDKSKELIFVIFLMPSIIFWGSGVLKEGVLFFALGFLIKYLFKIYESRIRFFYVLLILVCSYLIILVKFYVLAALLPGIIFLFLVRKKKEKLLAKYPLIIFLFALITLNFHHVNPRFNVLSILAHRQVEFINLANGGTVLMNDTIAIVISPENKARDIIHSVEPKKYYIREGSSYMYYRRGNLLDTFRVAYSRDTSLFEYYDEHQRAGSVISIPRLKPNVWSFIKNTPNALYNAFFRPHIFEAKNPLMLLSALENLFILVFALVCLYFRKRTLLNWDIIIFCLSYVFILFALTGLITPILGAIVRYKTPALPFLMIALLLILDKDKLIAKFPRLKFLKSKAGK